MQIQVVDRKTKKIEEEEIYGKKALALAYGTTFFSKVFSWLFLPLFTRVPLLSKFYGFLQKQASSQKKIKPFIKAFQIDEEEFETTSFVSFNDFFIRTLKKEKRPIDPDPSVAVLPADGRYLVFPELEKADSFYVKGQRFQIDSFLQDRQKADRYREGSLVLARLCPTDYHRFHFPVEGTPKKAEEIKGALFSVNPIALRQRLSILWENKRVITEIETKEFGMILYVEIGATFVGSVHQTYQPFETVKKGDEKGYFEFGGSCLALFFEKGKITFDEDLLENSKKSLETKALFGSSMGRSNK